MAVGGELSTHMYLIAYGEIASLAANYHVIHCWSFSLLCEVVLLLDGTCRSLAIDVARQCPGQTAIRRNHYKPDPAHRALLEQRNFSTHILASDPGKTRDKGP